MIVKELEVDQASQGNNLTKVTVIGSKTQGGNSYEPRDLDKNGGGIFREL